MSGNEPTLSAARDVDERESQLSAMYDGELPPAECELVARRLSRDENLRCSWENYALIGAAMRGETLAGRRLAPRVVAGIGRSVAVDASASADSADLALAVGMPSASAPAPAAHIERPPRMPRWAVPASGLGLAAGVAVVGVFGVLWLGSTAREPVSTASILPPVGSKVAEVVIPAAPRQNIVAKAEVASRRPVSSDTASSQDIKGNGEPLSYVTPPITSGSRGGTAGFELAGYVGAHSTVSAPMLRHSAMSAVIAVETPVTLGPAPQGEAVSTAAEGR
jgi:negative regulator of sigma E activity